jgi:[ribosomal protein S5]-alanine N-acetyltransferase
MVRIAPVSSADLPEVQQHLADGSVAQTCNIPEPYPSDGARSWYSAVQGRVQAGRSVVFAVHDGGFAGIVAVNSISTEAKTAELDFWTARSRWGQGICTESVRLAVMYCEQVLGLDTLHSAALCRNPASSRVLLKNGFEEVRRFMNAGEFGRKFLEPMIRYRKQLSRVAEAVSDPGHVKL